MKNKLIVNKLISYSEKILQYCLGTSYDTFSEDTKLVEACVFNLSQMGELANRLDADFTKQHAEIPWHYLYALRNRIVHDYEGVNLRLVWEIISEDLPPLLENLKAILRE